MALAATGVTVFFTIGRWLVVQDPLQHADVIVVLSGQLPDQLPCVSGEAKIDYQVAAFGEMRTFT